MDWKALFGDAEHLTLDELTAKLEGRKVIDLKEGGYVGQDKLDAEIKARKAAEATATKATDDLTKLTDGDDSPAKQLDALTKRLEAAESAQVESAKALTRKTREAAVAEKLAHLSPKLRRVALQDAEAMLSEDDDDFDAALVKLIADDPDYAEPEEGDEKPPVRVRTGDAPKGKADEDLFLEVLNKP